MKYDIYVILSYLLNKPLRLSMSGVHKLLHLNHFPPSNKSYLNIPMFQKQNKTRYQDNLQHMLKIKPNLNPIPSCGFLFVALANVGNTTKDFCCSR